MKGADRVKRLACSTSLLLLLAACDTRTEPVKKTPPAPPALKLDAGPGSPPIMEPPKPKPPAPVETTKPAGPVGKTAVAASFACPQEGCTVTFPSKGACLKHADTQMKEQWFICAKDSVKEPVPGKCAKCGADLTRTLQ